MADDRTTENLRASRIAKVRRIARVAVKVHGRNVAIALGASALGYALVRIAVTQTPGSGEQGFCYTVAGVAIAAAGKAFVDMLQRAEAYRQGAYTERAKAVQRIMEQVRALRRAGRDAWVEHVEPNSRFDGLDTQIDEHEIAGLINSDSEGDYRRSLEMTRSLAFTEDVWIGREGVDAVRRLVDELSKWEFEAFDSADAFVTAFNVEFERLRLELLAGLGFYFE